MFMARRLRGLVLPAEQAKNLAEAAGELSEADGALSGELTAEGAQKILVGSRTGGRAPQIEDAGGSVKFWLEEGVLSKYEYTLKAKMKFGEREFEINRTVTVEIKDIGKTEVEIPEEALAKLQG